MTQSKVDLGTEAKIKAAAKVVFYRKGFAATRTRDIAEEAGLNLALLNYYFRSKAKLFEIIMAEAFSEFIQGISAIFGDDKTSLEEKVYLISERYIDFVVSQPEMPTFLITEMRNNPEALLEKLPLRRVMTDTVFFRQHALAVENGMVSEPNPIHFFLNLIGLIIFPFIMKPITMSVNSITETTFNELMMERKKLIPKWIMAMFKA